MIFGFKGNDATITIKRADGVYVDGKKVEPVQQPVQVVQPTTEGDQNGNRQPQTT